MTTSFTRSGAIALLAGALVSFAAPAYAARNTAAETYVQTQGSAALQSLANRSQSASARAAQFATLMQRFADVPRIANFVLGRYSAQLRADPALRRDWTAAFQDYCIAVYEDQLDRYRGNALTVTGSVERVAGRDVVVRSTMAPNAGGRALPIQWRILKQGDTWKVVDVSLVLDGNEIWLAQQQQRDFLAQLDRSNGDIRALITSVRATTAQTRARISGRS